MRALRASTALFLIALLKCHPAFAGPEGGLTIGGSAVINKAGSRTTINQSSNRAIVRWDSFDVGAAESVVFNQPSASSITVNRIQDSKASQINGSVSANGTILLLNPNGVMFGRTSRVDVGGLVASTSDLSDDQAFMAGGALKLDRVGHAGASIINRGRITVAPGGLAGFVAPTVENHGLISARMGKIHLAGGDLATFDLAGDGLIEIAVSDETLTRRVRNTGTMTAEGGEVVMTAAAARGMVESLISNEGRISAPTLNGVKGRVKLKGEGALVQNTGTIAAKGTATEKGGDVEVAGGFVALGGTIDASGATGGTVTVDAESTLSLAGNINADGVTGAGGRIALTSGGNTWETTTSKISANGKTSGGFISAFTAQNLLTSGTYSARGLRELGGQIDISAGAVKMLSASVDASGAKKGGQIRIGGEYQGGKGLPIDRDDVPNAEIVTLDRGTRLRADGEDSDSEGGRVIVWSDVDTLALGTIYARPGKTAGAGGFVEVSSAGVLTYGATIQTGQNGRSGQVLLDPKNITITDGSFNPTAIIMGRGYTGSNIHAPFLNAQAATGYAVSLDGQMMAVGHHTGDSADGLTARTGAVYLYTFSDASFSGGTLQAIIGSGYTGGKNINMATSLNAVDEFGVSVSLDNNRLAVGAQFDDGVANGVSNVGAVHLFTFTDATFSGGQLAATIGHGYTGGKNLNLSAQLGASDSFGRGVSLDGNRLAVGAMNGDGVSNGVSNAGEVYLFTFSDAAFTGGALAATIGSGYTGGNNINQALNSSDLFGASLSLSGNRLAVGAYGGDGITNGVSAAGEVYLYTFTDSAFSGGVLAATLGQGYTGGNNYDMAALLGASDNFGYSVSLDGNRLAVGAIGDDANGNSSSASGAVYLFSFADGVFTTPTLEARIGNNYAALGGKNLSRANEAGGNDAFGASVSLDGNRLVVGAYGDDGPSNFNTDGGAFHYYTFSDAAFTGGTWQGTLGTGYTGGKNIAFAPTSGDGISNISVSLSDNRIAIGVPEDDGFGNTLVQSGAVYLYTFASNDYDGATLQSIIGHGYTGGKNVNLSGILGAGDRFGYDVSLDGNRLAVGAPFDDGNANVTADSGGVYLFTFTDANFSGGTLQARLGRNYAALGGKNYSVANVTSTSDYFGSAVSLNGNRLAVGSYGDDGQGNTRSNASGAVYLFTFSDAAFSGTTLQSIIGYGYTGGKNYNLAALENGDNFGLMGLSLDGNRLAVTAQGDDGQGNTVTNAGAVYLFSFSDALFSTPTLQATVGAGYTGGKNINVAGLGANDYVSGVAIEGTTLVFGSSRDDGATNAATDAGAVYIYEFTDNLFSNGTLDAIIGSGYTGGNNINIATSLSNTDYFGRDLALNQGTLVVTSPLADGFNNAFTGSGELLIFRGSGYAPSAGGSFANLSTSNIGITPGNLVALLSTPQDVTLQASNDITIDSAIIVNNASGNGGTLTLQAGRSIIVNADIVTDNGNLNLYANEDLSTGVIDAQRDAGAATITMATGVSINAGTGTVHVRLDDGTGKTNATSGNIVLGSITAGNLLAQSMDMRSSIVLNGQLNVSGSGTAITLAAGKDFINNYGAAALLTPSGRWLVYSDSPVLNTLGGLTPAFSQFNCTYQGACTPGAGNGMFYEYGDKLLSISVSGTRYYGDANPNGAALQGSYVYKGFQNGDTAAVLDALPTASVNVSATATAGAGTQHGITLSGGSDNYYQYYFLDDSSLTITKRPVNVSWDALPTKEYGDDNPILTAGDFDYNGFVGADGIGVLTDFDVNYGTVDETTNAGTYTASASMQANNYIFIVPTVNYVVTKREITASWNSSLSRIYGNANPSVNTSAFTYSGLVNGDVNSAITASANYTGINAASNVGSYTVGANFTSGNYLITNAPTTTLNITKRDITATVKNASRQYGDGGQAFTWNDVTWTGLVNGDTGAALDTMTVASAATNTSNAGTNHAITLTGFLDNNYNLLSSTAGTLSIIKRNITASVNNATRQYGDGGQAFGWNDVTWNNLANGETGAVIDAATVSSAATNTSNAGTNHAITLSGFSDNNYNLTSSTNGTLNIIKRNITASVNNASRQYGDGGQAFGWNDVTWNNLANGETGAVIDAATIASAATNTSNAGTNHAITLTGFVDNNYNLTSSTNGTLNIIKRNITASVNNASRQYGDGGQAFGWGDVTWNNLANGETGAVIDAATIASTATNTSNAGTNHAITLTGFVDNNYNLTSSTNGTLSIIKRNITASVNNATRQYGDGGQAFGWGDVTWNNLANGETGAVIDAATIASGATNTSNAGTSHAITLSGFSDDNYNLTSSTNGTLNIIKRNITAAAKNVTRQYGDGGQGFTRDDVTWSNLANGETGAVIDAVTISSVATNTSNAGTNHTISISGFSDNNYNLTGMTSGTLDITKRDITAAVNNASRQYGAGGTAFGRNDVTWSNFANGETAAVLDSVAVGSAATNASSAGTSHSIDLTGFSDGNYNLAATTSGTLTITKRDITASVNNATRQYGDGGQAFTWTDVTWNGLVNGDTGAMIDAATVSSAATNASNAGTSHAITLTGFDDDNYNLLSSTNGTLSIIKRNITASVNNATRQYGDGGQAFTWNNVTWNNLVNGDTGADINAVTVSSAATNTSNAGTSHAIILSGFSDNNYNLTGSTGGTLNIIKRDITASVNNTTRQYGDGGQAFGWSNVTWNNLANGQTGAVIDAVTVSSAATNTSNAGTSHAITLGGFSDNNYNLTAATDGTLDITKRNITATVKNATRQYGDGAAPFDWTDVTWNNLVNGDTGAMMDAATVSSAATNTSNAGTSHAITLTGFDDNNYNLTAAADGTLSIIKRNITASVNNATRQYGDANPVMGWADVVWSNLANGETGAEINSLTLTAPGALATANAGSQFAIAISGFSDNNYALQSHTAGVLDITKRDITASVNDASRYYGYADPVMGRGNVVWSNLANGETSAVLDAVTVAAAGSSLTDAAGTSRSIDISGFSDNNYNLVSSTSGTLSINKAPVTVVVQNAARDGGLANPPFAYIVDGLRNGDAASLLSGVSLSTLADVSSPSGTYAITATGGTAANYFVNAYQNGVLTVGTVVRPPASSVPAAVVHEMAANIDSAQRVTAMQPDAESTSTAFVFIPDEDADSEHTSGRGVLIAVTEKLRQLFHVH